MSLAVRENGKALLLHSKKVFLDFTCILHSPLSYNKLEGVGNVCKILSYTHCIIQESL